MTVALPAWVQARQEAERVLSLEAAARQAELRTWYKRCLGTETPNRDARRRLAKASGVRCPPVPPTPVGEQ